ncbi:MAG: hypothetical protein H6595_10120 [Flavobacteriales bacterium]|nr:hypothetical protein [Flavobacteriales bacterium]MCB9167817.1 hypothetical protein [Flavobacteriales bacterium]
MERAIIVLFGVLLAVVAWARIPRPRGRLFDLLGITLIMALLVESYGTWCLAYRPTVPNSYAYNLYNLLELALLLLLFDTHRPRLRKWYLAAGGLVLVATGWSMTRYAPLEQLLTPVILVYALTMTLLLMALLWDLAQHSKVPLQRLPMFWLFMGLLVYFGGLAPIIGLTPYLLEIDEHLAARAYLIMPVLGAIRYLLAAVACSMERARRRAGT